MKLGDTQKDVLRSLCEHGGFPGGWIWGNRSQTIRLLDSLIKRGMATRTLRANGRSYFYSVTEAGRQAFEAIKLERIAARKSTLDSTTKA